MTKIIIIQRIFTNYRKAFFDQIARYHNLRVVHSKNKSGIKQIQTSYSKEVSKIQYTKNETNVLLKVFPELIRFKPQIVVTELSIGSLNMYQAFLFARIFNYKVVLWGHGYDRKKGFNPAQSFFDKIRLFFMKKSEALLLYGQEAKIELAKFVNKDKIFVAQNTLDTPSLLAIRDELDSVGKKVIKKKIGFEKKYNLIFVGRLLKDKKPESLLVMFEKLRSSLKDDLAIHFVGSGEMESVLKNHDIVKANKNAIILHGPIYEDQKIAELLYASDIMVMPGDLGLSVNHAFCFDCPVISYKQGGEGPFHGPEIEYVIHDETGFLVAYNDIDSLASKVDEYLSDSTKQEYMRQQVRNLIENKASLDQMVRGFEESINYCLPK